MGEIKKFLPVADKYPNFFCTVWEDNQSTIKVADIPKYTLRTKHIALKYHHFRKFVSNGTLNINPIDTLEKTADIFTKPLDKTEFEYLSKEAMWMVDLSPDVYDKYRLRVSVRIHNTYA